MGRVLGLDIGEKRIGVAVSDPSGRLASPAQNIERRGMNRDLRAVEDLRRQHDAEILVLGFPLGLDGKVGFSARMSRFFGLALRRQFGCEVRFHDERFSTVGATLRLREAGVRAAKIKEKIDMASAALILQSWLDMMTSRPAE